MKDTQRKIIGIILLAAGKSSRLGRPKQSLLYNGRTFVQHSLHVALSSAAKLVLVVLGAHADRIKKEIEGIDVHVIENPEWEEGMASSIRSGLKAFNEIAPAGEGVILMVCDQPFVTASLLNQLIAAHENTGKPIVACGYENTFGPPVFFHRSFFAELQQLKGDVGARKILSQHAELAEVIPFEEGGYDVDTEADYKRLLFQGP